MAQRTEREALLKETIVPIVISTPFAVGDVYSYLIKDEKIVLVDCGQASDSSYQQLASALQKEGVEVGDIDEIWLTHGHPDHYGQAARLADKSGAELKGHPLERANFAANSDTELFREFFDSHHIDQPVIDEMLNQLHWLKQFQIAIEPDWIEEGDRLSSGSLSFTVKHAPGHAPGHVVFYHDSGLYFGGDVLLEHISTNALINFNPDTGERNKSLLQYRQSLQWMKEQQGLVLPGHGKQIRNIAEIAGNHLNEQKKRYDTINRILQSGPKTLMEISRILFEDALANGAHFLVYSEVVGYLDWGIEEGVLREEQSGRVKKYVVA